MDLGFAFMLGLVGSVHCVQMCGPIVLAYSLALTRESRGRQLAAHLAYNAGRIATYAALGAIAGLAGGAVGFVGRLAGLEQAAMWVGGLLLLAAAASTAGLVPGWSALESTGVRPVAWISARTGSLMRSPAALAKGAMGLALGLLPCGLVYAGLATAASTATPLAGAATMAAFGVGTSGALLAVGIGSSSINPWLGRWSPRLAAVAMALMGALLMWRAGMASHMADAVHASHRMHSM